MSKRATSSFCNRDIDFPSTLYLGFIWIKDTDDQGLLLPGSRLFQSTEKTLEYIEELQHTYQMLGNLHDSDLLIIPLTFTKVVPLKRNYWETKSKEQTLYERLASYVHVIREYKDSQILVVSQGFSDDFEKFSHAAAMSNDTDTNRLEKIILESDTYVDPTPATSARINTGGQA